MKKGKKTIILLMVLIFILILLMIFFKIDFKRVIIIVERILHILLN